MKLSDVLAQMEIKFYIENEKGFESLSLCSDGCDFACATFVDDCRFVDDIADNISMVITSEVLVRHLRGRHFGLCVVDNPRVVFFMLHNFLAGKEGYRRKQQEATIGENCKISKLSSVANMNVRIGNGVTIEEFVVVRENTVIGDDSIIRAGTIVGGEGFEFKRLNDSVLSVSHSGGVIIGKNVEIQQNSCIDRAVFPWDDTVVDDFTKIDNLVHIAHGAKLGRCVLVVADALIAGRLVVKNGAWIGPGVTTVNGIEIGQGARVNVGAIATKSVGDGESVTGNFAIPHDKFIQNLKKSVKEQEPCTIISSTKAATSGGG